MPKLARCIAPWIAIAAFGLAAHACQSDDSSTMSTHAHQITFDTPTPGWSLTPVAAYRVADEHWCVHELHAPAGMAAQVISQVSGRIRFEDSGPELPARHFVLGKTWAWNSNPEIEFPESLDSLQASLEAAASLKLLPVASE